MISEFSDYNLFYLSSVIVRVQQGVLKLIEAVFIDRIEWGSNFVYHFRCYVGVFFLLFLFDQLTTDKKNNLNIKMFIYSVVAI